MTHHRPERIADLIRAELARLLREEVRDPRVGFVTVTDVRMSPDLRHARVFVSILEDDPAETFAALERALPFLRRSLARSSGLRFTPQLQLLIDESIRTGSRIERILDEIHVDEADGTGDPPESAESGTEDPGEDAR